MKHCSLLSYYPVIKYILISLFTATIEAIIGIFLINKKGFGIIEANTISILMSTIIHYLLISKIVFNKRYSLWSITIYIVTFIFGIILQSIVIYYSYEFFLLNFSPYIRYVGSKILSITIPFAVVYSIRKKMYLLKDKII